VNRIGLFIVKSKPCYDTFIDRGEYTVTQDTSVRIIKTLDELQRIAFLLNKSMNEQQNGRPSVGVATVVVKEGKILLGRGMGLVDAGRRIDLESVCAGSGSYRELSFRCYL
jgi:hypothetical protein